MRNSLGISGIFIIIGVLILLGVTACVLFILLNKRYLNRRLKGEGKIRKFPQPLTIILCAILVISVITNGVLAVKLFSAVKEGDKRYDELLETTHTRTSLTITDLANHSQYAVFRDAILNDALAGYTITIETDGDFECYKAFLSNDYALLESTLLVPQYFVYIRYTGAILDGIQMERRNYYNADETSGYGSVGKFEPELLIIGNNIMPNLYWAIKTVIKIAPETAETKSNWNNLPVHSQSYFIICN